MGVIIRKQRQNNGILMITLNRPEKRNAINFQMIKDLREVIDFAENDESVKMLVIKGAGEQAFCSGGDLSEFHALETEAEAYKMLTMMGEILYRLATLSKPTIAYLNGAAVGGGCEIAAACDIRIANHHTVVGFVQANQGITTGWGGGTLLLEKLQAQEAMQMLMSGAVISALEAKEIGFISEIMDDEHCFTSYLEKYGNKQMDVLKAYKRLLVAKWEAAHLKERMDEEIKVCSKLWETEEHISAVKQFLQRRK